MSNRVVLALAGLALMPAVACAQWSDNFDTYSVGTINGQGGWKGWDNVPAAAGSVTNNTFLSAPNSQMVAGATDSVHQYSGYTSGQWQYGGSLFIPSGLTTSGTYMILLNNYTDVTGPDNWSTELFFNFATNLVYDDLANVGLPSPGSASIPIVRNAWVPFRVDINLTANTQSMYYNNTLIMATAWMRQGLNQLQNIAAVDLYANSGGGAVFYDNLYLQQIPAPGALALLAVGGLLVGRRRR